MYAIIRAGGKQYTVRPGDTVRVAKMPKDLGAEFNMDEVLLVGGEKVHIGEPVLKGAKVSVIVVAQDRAAKVMVFKKKRRQGYRRTNGHRQDYTELFVQSIEAPGGQTMKAETKAQIVDPAKIQERKDLFQAQQAEQTREQKMQKREAKKEKQETRKAAAPKKAVNKRGGKKVSSGTKAKKKTAAKKAKK